MQQLLPVEYTQTVILKTAIVIEIKKQQAQRLILQFKDQHYLEKKGVNFLKQIKKIDKSENVMFLLCFKEDQEYLQQSSLTQYQPYTLHELEIPSVPAYTDVQFKQWSVYWPLDLSYSDLEIDITGEEKNLQDHMKQLLQQAHSNYLKGNRFNACILMDPLTKEILASAEDTTQRQKTSIQHCVMNCINSLQQIELSKELEKINKKRKSSQDLDGDQQYFCTGLDLVVIQEPCIMCAMALIHSRIRRVYYSIPNETPNAGGINSKTMLNHMEQLNHKYRVFRYLLYEDVQKVFQELK